jgi:hypothetical protein
VSLFISNPSRGGAAPQTAGDPIGVKAADPIRVSLRETASFVDLSSIQMGVGFAKTHAIGSDFFDKQLKRTKLSSVVPAGFFTSSPTMSCVAPNVTITKTSAGTQASSYFTSVDLGSDDPKSLMATATLSSTFNPSFANGDPDPMGPVLGLEVGPRRTAVYVFLLRDPISTNYVLRICGPSVNGVRLPDMQVLYGWNAAPSQYIILWSEEMGTVQVYADNAAGAGGIATATLLASIPMGDFQQFGAAGSVPAGGAADATVIYGVEGKLLNSVDVSQVSLATTVGFPFIDGARPGTFKTYLDSDVTMGFSGAVDPTRLTRGGAWFKTVGGDAAGAIVAAAGGYSRIWKKTPGTTFSIFRNEPCLAKSATDGFMVEFKTNISVSGGAGFSTGVALQLTDGQTLFQLDFFFDGAVHNIGLLKAGGNPTLPSDHITATAPIDYTLKTLRFVVNTRRNELALFDVADLTTPLFATAFVRGALPVAVTSGITFGHVISGATVGTLDIYSLKYSYFYQAWEFGDGDPVGADPAYAGGSAIFSGGPLSEAVMPGIMPLPYTAGGATGTTVGATDGWEIDCDGGETFIYTRSAVDLVDADRGGILEFSVRVSDGPPNTRTGAFGVLDDGLNAYLLSFVNTDSGRFVCIPLAAGAGQFQEYAGQVGLAAKVSYAIDWRQFNTYRLERRPRDGVYLYINNVQVLVLPDTARYSFPATQFGTAKICFGQLTDEGATSVWKFVRTFFGSGYEISTVLNKSSDEIRTELSNVRTTVVVSAGP